MSSVPKYVPHYTVADYQQWEGDWELIDGVAIAMTPSPFGVHQAIMTRLARALADAIDRAGCHCEVVVELDWIVSDDTVVRPDVMILCDGIPEKHLMSPPALAAEILSAATATKDRTAKRELYAAQGVPYYLLIDPQSRSLDILRSTSSDYTSSEYEPVRSPLDQVVFTMPDGCQVTGDFTRLFSSAEHDE